MKDFKENNCRVCKNVFCCKVCREKHEYEQHNIFSGCEICISGKTFISSIKKNVIGHIVSCHWPLHCVFCKRIFGSEDELFQHNKCPLANKLGTENSPITPHRSYQSNLNSTSPYFFDKKYNKNAKHLKVLSNLVATSTPMQKETDNNLLEKIQEVIITPVDHPEIKENNLQGSSSRSNLKRKVTFWDTPITDSFSKKSKNMTMSTQEGSTYYTAGEESADNPIATNRRLVPCLKITETPTIEEDEENEKKLKSVNIFRKSEETIWISAVNISTTQICTKEPTSPDMCIPNNQFVTPMVPKGRKMNVLSPTTIQKQEISIKFEGPIQISSTPNSSAIPIKSAPTKQDIFENIDHLPSTSKSDLENWNVVNYNNDKSELTSHFKVETNSHSDYSVTNNLWTSVTKIVKNVLQTFSNTIDTVNLGSAPISRPLKRHLSDNDLLESPMVKRYKSSDIKCRRNIREMTPIDKYMEAYRTTRSREFHINIVNSLKRTATKTLDKATQTDESYFESNLN